MRTIYEGAWIWRVSNGCARDPWSGYLPEITPVSSAAKRTSARSTRTGGRLRVASKSKAHSQICRRFQGQLWACKR